jgi:hypothetical protein
MSGRIYLAALATLLCALPGLADLTLSRHKQPHSDPLAGVWELRMALGSLADLDSTVGVLSLSQQPEPVRGAWVSMAVASHGGVYSAELQRVGIQTELMDPIAAREDGKWGQRTDGAQPGTRSWRSFAVPYARRLHYRCLVSNRLHWRRERPVQAAPSFLPIRLGSSEPVLL